jgi:hypothetical protein
VHGFLSEGSLARQMIGFALWHLRGLRRWMLVTRDAQQVYTELGFKPVAYPERHTEISVPDSYRAAAS